MARYTPQYVRQVITTNAAQHMVRALKTVVAPGGTAPQAALEHHLVAGKTGTAQKPGPGGYMPGKFVSSFIGFFPADDPQLCIGVFFDEPSNGYFGGTVAAPVFQRVAERSAAYLGLPADELIGQQSSPSGDPRAEGVRTAFNMDPALR
jgi:cell division protein FtsI/penicillin-binding protein 2